MPKRYERAGLSFQYPENWIMTEEDREDGWAVEIQSPATAFFLATFQPGQTDPELVLQEALTGMKAEYKEFECAEVQATIASSPAIGFDVNFVSLDFTNTALLRAVETAEGILLLLCQCTDAELELNGLVLQAMLKSITLEE
jgi:hypothetical protein